LDATFARVSLCRLPPPPPPPVTETLSHRFRNTHAPQSDGQFIDERGDSEAYSSVFVCSLQPLIPYSGKALHDLLLCLAHQRIIAFAPVLNHTTPYTMLIAFDTNLSLPMRAVGQLIVFIEAEDDLQSVSYSQSWARDIPRESWQYISAKIRENISQNSHVSF
jgi:hypothetical protein